MSKPEHDELLNIYELIVGEEHYFLEAHQIRVAFYTKIVLGIVAVTVAGVFLASQWYHFAALCAGPILTYAISNIARDACFRFYQRFLETITTRAKIEQNLGMTQPQPEQAGAEDAYWPAEPLVAARHVTSRKRYRSSEIFIVSSMKKGFHRWTERLFRGFEVLSGVGFIGLLFLTVLKATETLGSAT